MFAKNDVVFISENDKGERIPGRVRALVISDAVSQGCLRVEYVRWIDGADETFREWIPITAMTRA